MQSDPLAQYRRKDAQASPADPLAQYRRKPDPTADPLAQYRRDPVSDFSGENEKDASGAAVVRRSAPDRLGGNLWDVVKSVPESVMAANTSVSRAIQWALSGDPLRGMKELASDARGMITGAGMEHQRVENEAYEAMKRGDYLTAARKVVGYAIPLAGPELDRRGDQAASGDIAGAIGGTLGLGLTTVSPVALAKSIPIRMRPMLRNANPAEADAAAFGLREGIPVDAGTASGNRFIKTGQKLADESALGSFSASKGAQVRADKLATLGEQLAAKTGKPYTTAEQTGEIITSRLGRDISRANKAADVEYGRLRAMEEAAPAETRSPRPGAPVESVKFAVDVRPWKEKFKPLQAELETDRDFGKGLSGANKDGAIALKDLMSAPDFASLSTVDRILGELKGLARQGDPLMRTRDQGNLARMVSELDAQVRAAAAQAGPDVLKALEEGRKATKQKFKVNDVRERLMISTGDEPAKITKRLLAAGDTAIDKLRDLKSVAPEELAQLGRSFLDGLLDLATEAKKFDHADRLYAEWQKLGPETKRLLFSGPAHVHDLDRFFLLAKKLAEVPNPSGSAMTVVKGIEGSMWFTNPALGIPVTLTAPVISKMLHNPAIVKALTRTMELQVGGKRAAQISASINLTRLMREAGLPMEAAADREGQRSSEGPGRRQQR
jgi:hypothetical protein